MLTDDGLDWRVRDDFLDEVCAGTTLYTKWLPWPDVEVQTWLAPALPGHVRAHCIKARRMLGSFEGGFPASWVGAGNRGYRQSPGFVGTDFSNAFTGIRDLSTTPRRGAVIRNEPNTNIVWPLTVTPGLAGEHVPGETWLFTAVAAIPGAGCTDAGCDFLAGLTLDRTGPVTRIMRGARDPAGMQCSGQVHALIQCRRDRLREMVRRRIGCLSCTPSALGLEALSQTLQINQCALVNATANFLRLIARSHCKDDSPAFHRGDDRFRRYPLSCRRRRKVPDVDDRAEGGLARREVLANGA